jgi:hypothetical protein
LHRDGGTDPVVLIPIPEAARLLEIRQGTLRRWCREGLPHSPGQKGRGRKTLVDPERARNWRGAPIGERELLALANDMPIVLARAAYNCWIEVEGVDRRRLAGIASALWYSAATSVLDRMREDCPAVPDVQSLPPEIDRLTKIARND